MSKKNNNGLPSLFFRDHDVSRKEFLRVLGLAGLSASLPFAFSKEAEASCTSGVGSPSVFGFPLFISVHASGGWDPTSFCDPKGDAHNINRYSAGLIETLTTGGYQEPIKLAPSNATGNTGNGINWLSNENKNFINNYKNKIRIVNGIDTTTNNHDTGPIYIWSGKINVGHPTIAALVAGARGPQAPLAFINNGGYSYTGGVISSSQLNNIDRIKELARPNREKPSSASDVQTYFSDCTHQRIEQFRKNRLEKQTVKQNLPRLQESLKIFKNAREATEKLEFFVAEAESIENRLSTDAGFKNNFDKNFLFKQFMIARAAWKAGLCASVSMSISGFDSHVNHDTRQRNSLNNLLNGVRLMATEAAAHGGINDVLIAVGSDFGRTPRYNAGSGKDHWPITSMMFLGGAIPSGGTTGGSSDDRWYADPNKSPVTVTGSNRLRIKPQHVQHSLRKLLEIGNKDITVRGSTRKVDDMFPLINGSDDHIPIFAPGK